jgi:hypothetical protein
MILGALSLALALAVGPEQQVTPPDLAPETSTIQEIDAASDGDGWLVVRREYGVVANRVDRNGDLVDRVPIAVGGGGTGTHSAVTWGVDAYLVTWTEQGGIRAAFIDRDGNRSPAFAVSANAPGVRQIACAFDGSRFLIAWSVDAVPSHGAFYRTKFVAMLDTSGSVIATDISLGQGLPDPYFGLAAGKSEFMMVTSINDALIGIAVDDDGHYTIKYRDLGVHGTIGRRPFAAFNGSDFLVLWDRAGALVREDGNIVPIPPLASPAASLTVVGQRTIVTTAVAGEMRAVILDSNGVEQQSTTVVQAPDRDFAPLTAAWNGRALLAAYVKGQIGFGTTYVKFVDASGALIDPSARQRRELLEPSASGNAIAFAPVAQKAPAIAAADDHDALAVWTEREEASIRTFTRAVVLRDGVADDAPIDIGPSGASSTVAFGESSYLVVTTRLDSMYSIEGRRVARDGTPIDAAPFPILSAAIAQPGAVAFDGANFVVAAVIYSSAADRGRVVAVRVRPDGTVLDPNGITVYTPSGVQRLLNPPIIASNGDGSIILWREGRDLLAATLSRAGTPTAAVKVSALVDVPPSVAWSGSSYMVSWTDIFAHALRWAPLDAAGNPTGSPGMLPLAAANPIDATATARLGDGALIAWADLSTTFDTDIRALRVASDGSRQGDPFTVAASQLPEWALVATGGRAGARIAYERAIDYPGTFRLSRVFTRPVAEAPPPRRRAAR